MSEEAAPIVELSHERRLALAYQRIFGPEGERSSDQQLVWEDIESFCYAFRLVTEKTGDNKIDPSTPEFNDGRRSVWLRFRGAIIKARLVPKALKVSRSRRQKQ